MDVELISQAIQGTIEYGIFAGLFISLLVYVIKNNDKRETAYQSLIDKLNYEILMKATQNSDKITGLTDDIDVLDTKIQHMSEKVDAINTKVDNIDKKIDVLPYKLPNP